MLPHKAAFLDRDGTLIKAITNRVEYPGRPTAPWTMAELEFVPDLLESIAILKEAGYLTIVVTNQPDFHKGHLDWGTWEAIHNEVLVRVDPDDCFVCKHLAAWKCSCRKPLPGMLFAAAYRWDIDLAKSFMIGDTEADMGAGRAAGCQTILIRRPYNTEINKSDGADDSVPSLLFAARMIAPQ